MDSTRWLDDYLARIRAIPWLRCDAEMDAFDAAAQRWVADRVEEHAVALSDARRAEPVTLAWAAVRSIDEARTRSGHVNYTAEAAVAYELPALAWLSLLDDARWSALERAKEVLGPERRLEVAEAVWAVLRGPATALREAAFAEQQRTNAWSGGGQVRGPEDYVVGAPGGEALVTHALWTLSRDDDAPSPWEPLIALWERGVCTLAALDGSLLVYVPRQSAGASPHTPGRDPGQERFTGAIGRLSPWGFDRTKLISKEARAVLTRFNAHGFGPLPGMYAPVNVSTVIMATNWPGPPDPYVFPPPAKLDADALDAAERVHIRQLVGTAPGAAPPAALPGDVPAWYERFRAWFAR